MDIERSISLKHFWIIKSVLILFVVCASLMGGYLIGTWQLSLKLQGAMLAEREATTKEYPVISLVQSGTPFCATQGNIYPAKILPTKRSLMPMFKTIRAREF